MRGPIAEPLKLHLAIHRFYLVRSGWSDL